MIYPVYPEPDGYDRPVNPYGQHMKYDPTPLPQRGERTRKNRGKKPPKK